MNRIPTTLHLPESVAKEGKQLLSVFKNAIAFTLALTTLTEVSKESPDYLYLILSSICLICIVTIIQIEVDVYKASISAKGKGIQGPIKCISFLSSITLNILTQFLSTLVAKYVLTFVPDPSNIKEVSYVLLIVLSLFWCMLYALGIDWHEI